METPSLESIYLLLKEHVKDSSEAHQDTKESFKLLNGRVRHLEVWRGFMAGGIGILAFLILLLK